MARRRCPTHKDSTLRVRGPDDAAALVRLVVRDEYHEGELVIALDAKRWPLGVGVRGPGVDQPSVDASQLIDLADELRSLDLLLVTFVDDDALAPSCADVARYEGLRVGCAAAGIELLDHLLMSGHRWRSVREAAGGLSAAPGASTRW